jgi:transcriptional regulator with XRE-family HTH domain
MTSQVGQFLRHLRKARGLTLQQATRAAGISLSALDRWETGVNQPRLSELEALLTALRASAKQRGQVLALMDAPRARAQVQDKIFRIAQQTGLGPMPNGGDLLRAMRLRRGLPLEAVAARLGVTVRTLRRWERADVWPGMEQLHRLCYALGAHEEELVALTSGQFLQTPTTGVTSLERARARMQQLLDLDQIISRLALTELGYLTLEAELWPLATRSVEGRRLLAEAYANHAQFLSRLDRFGEAGQHAERALDLIPEKSRPEMFWLRAGIVSALSAVRRGAQPTPKRGLDQLRHWLPLARWPEFEAWVLADMAEYLSLSGEAEVALSLSKQACQVAERCEGPIELRMRQRDRARLLLRMERPEEALPLLTIVERENPWPRADISLLRTEAHLGAGEPSEAQDWLERAMTDIQMYDLAYLQPQAATLAQRF